MTYIIANIDYRGSIRVCDCNVVFTGWTVFSLCNLQRYPSKGHGNFSLWRSWFSWRPISYRNEDKIPQGEILLQKASLDLYIQYKFVKNENIYFVILLNRYFKSFLNVFLKLIASSKHVPSLFCLYKKTLSYSALIYCILSTFY